MKTTVNRSEFRDAFLKMDRKDQFSYQGLNALFEYLEEYEESTGEEIELDVIALCCDFTEAPISDVLKEYNLETLEEIQDRTTVIMVDDENIIYGSF